MERFTMSDKMSSIVAKSDVIIKTKVQTKAHKDADGILTNLELDMSNCTLLEVVDGFKQTKVIQWQRANRPNLPANESTVRVQAEHAGKGAPPKSDEEIFSEMTPEDQMAKLAKLEALMKPTK